MSGGLCVTEKRTTGSTTRSTRPSGDLCGLGFKGLGCKGLGFKGLGFKGLGFRV